MNVPATIHPSVLANTPIPQDISELVKILDDLAGRVAAVYGKPIGVNPVMASAVRGYLMQMNALVLGAAAIGEELGALTMSALRLETVGAQPRYIAPASPFNSQPGEFDPFDTTGTTQPLGLPNDDHATAPSTAAAPVPEMGGGQA